jgi:Zn finger protein HypA/HybF involved in hydrogenase expression
MQFSRTCFKIVLLSYGAMATTTAFLVEAAKFSQDNIHTTLACSKCAEVFQKEFPIALEGLTSQFKCPVCGALGEADLPYKEGEEQEKLQEDLVVGEAEVEEWDTGGSSEE